VTSTVRSGKALTRWPLSSLVRVHAEGESAVVLHIARHSSLLSTLRCASPVVEHKFSLPSGSMRDEAVWRLTAVASASASI
jgi:hypothetical protein